MRPQQQNRRMRGRNNNGGGNNQNRKGPNPLTRNYESNGPDVKIRGSAQQVADKYAQLARDAQSSGDRVMAENYLQHAEHYNRIIAAAQAQMPIQQQSNRDDSDDDIEDDRDDFDNQGAANANNGGAVHQNNGGAERQQPALNNGTGPQPVIEGMPAEVALNSRAPDSGRDDRSARAPNAPSGGDESGEQPRRGRRPRRGERPRMERDEDADSNEGLAQTLARGNAPEAAPAATESADDTDVVTADN